MTTPTKLEQEMLASAEKACRLISQIEGWTSAPVKESVYEAGFIAGYQAGFKRGAEIMREEAAKVPDCGLSCNSEHCEWCMNKPLIRALPIPKIGEEP